MLESKAALLAPLVLAGVATAAPQRAVIKEVQEQTESGPSVLVQLGSAKGIRVGQTVEVQRGKRTLGYGSVVKVFRELSVVSVGTIIPGAGELKAGDTVVFLDSGFTRSEPARARPKTKKPDVAPAKPERAPKPPKPSGKIVGVRGGVVLFDFGREAGLRVEEIAVDIEPGKTLIIRFLTVSEAHEDGSRTVFFELNGQPREVTVIDHALEPDAPKHPKADANNPCHVGASMPGMVFNVAVHVGDDVVPGQKLLTLEAMKMQTAVTAEIAGQVAEFHVHAGTQVEAGDLLVVIDK